MSLVEKVTENVYIYGAGEYGQLAFKYFSKIGIGNRVRGFIISNGKGIDNKLSIVKYYTVSEAEAAKIEGIIFVAVSGLYIEEIEKSLKSSVLYNSCRIEKMTLTDYYEMQRVINPIDLRGILMQSAPVDGNNGGNRGTTISRYYIKRFLDYATSSITVPESISTFEVGDLRYSEEYYPKASHSMLDYKKGQDLTKTDTLQENRYDIFLCTQVYNFLFDVPAAIKGSYYVLKEGGYLLCTVVGNISQVIQGDMDDYGDYWRFTYLGIQRLMEQVFDTDKIETISYGNAMATTAYMHGMCVEDLPRKELLDELDPEYALVIGIIARK